MSDLQMFDEKDGDKRDVEPHGAGTEVKKVEDSKDPLRSSSRLAGEDTRSVLIVLGALIMIIFTAYFVLAPYANNSSNDVPSLSASSPTASKDGSGITEDDNSTVSCPVCHKSMCAGAAEYKHQLNDADSLFYFDSEECYKKFLDHPENYVEVKYQVRVNVRARKTPDPAESAIPETPSNDKVSEPKPDMSAPVPETIPDLPTPDVKSGKPAANKTKPAAQPKPPKQENPGSPPAKNSSGDTTAPHSGPPQAPATGQPKADAKVNSGGGKSSKPGASVSIPTIEDIPLPPPQGGKATSPSMKLTPIAPPPGGKSNSY